MDPFAGLLGSQGPPTSGTPRWVYGPRVNLPRIEGTLYRDLNEFHSNLLMGDRAAQDSLARAYTAMEPDFRSAMADLDRKIRTAQQAGLQPSASWVFQQERYRQLEQQVQANAGRMAVRTAQTTTAAQAAAIREQEGLFAKMATGQAAYGPLGDVRGWARLPQSTITAYIGSSGPLVSTVAGQLSNLSSIAMREHLTAHIALGRSHRTTARILRDSVAGIQLTRAMTITRTETARARRLAALGSFQHNPTIRGWVWRAALDRSCPACLAMHGLEFSTDQMQQGHPNCRCVMVPMRIRGVNPDVGSSSEYLFRQAQIPGGLERIMGKGRADWWRQEVQRLGDTGMPRSIAGREALTSMVYARTHPVYGTSFQTRSLASLRNQGAVRTTARTATTTRPAIPEPTPPATPTAPTVPAPPAAATSFKPPSSRPDGVTNGPALKAYLRDEFGVRTVTGTTRALRGVSERTAKAVAEGAYEAVRDVDPKHVPRIWSQFQLASSSQKRSANAWWTPWQTQMSIPASRWETETFWRDARYGIQSGWHAGSKDADNVAYWAGRRSIVHEFGHGVDYYARAGGYSAGHARVWDRWFDTPSKLPSQYASHSPKEHAAEMYASLRAVRREEWTSAMEEFDILVDPFRAVRQHSDDDWLALGRRLGIDFNEGPGV